MLTIKYRDHRGSESVIPNVEHTSWHEGRLSAKIADGGDWTFGPNYSDEPMQNPVAFVMNETGATVARYEFYPQPLPTNWLSQVPDAEPPVASNADPEALAA